MTFDHNPICNQPVPTKLFNMEISSKIVLTHIEWYDKNLVIYLFTYVHKYGGYRLRNIRTYVVTNIFD